MNRLKPTLTKRQQAIFDFITESISRLGYAPTYRAIASRFRINVHAANCHVRAIESKRKLSRIDGKIVVGTGEAVK